MLYHTTWLISWLDPIKYIFEKPFLSGRVLKWQVVLSEYDIVYTTKKAIKGSAIADHLADNAPDQYESLDVSFPDDGILQISEKDTEQSADEMWKMYFDGAVNSSGSGIGAVIISPEGKQFPVAIKLRFDCTNNMAEYETCVTGLQAALELKVKRLEVFGDSALIIY